MTTYYVAKTGNDSNPGTEAAPWLTIQKAANTANAGDTVNIKAGTYVEHVLFPKSGTAGNYITFQSFSTNIFDVIVKPPVKTYLNWNEANPIHHSGNFEFTGMAYIKIKGLKFTNNLTAEPDAVISCEQGANNIIIDGCRLEEIHSTAVIAGYYKPSGQSYGAWDIIFTRNYVTRTGGGWQEMMSYDSVNRPDTSFNEFAMQYFGEGIDYKQGTNNGIISNNKISNVYNTGMTGGVSSGIYLDGYLAGSSNHKVFNNIVSKCAGIILGSEKGGMNSNNLIYNNVVYDCLWGIGQSSYTENGQLNYANNKIINNTVYNIESDSFFTWSNHGAIFRNNIAYQSGNAGINGNSTQDKNTWNLGISDPMFINALSHDFHLKAGSPVINKGTATDAPALDFDGKSRADGVDIGAFEYGGSNPKWKCSGAPDYICVIDPAGTYDSQVLCQVDCNNPIQYHKACVGGVCTLVAGAGTDECQNIGQTCGTTQSHKECINGICTSVLGAGTDECTTIGADCGCVPNPQCENPLNGYMNDGCGNRWKDAACNAVGNGLFSVTTYPVSGARIYLDNADSGAITPVILSVPAGSHFIRIALTGYQDITDTITLSSGGSIMKTYTLVPTTTQAGISVGTVAVLALGVAAVGILVKR